MRSAKRWTVVGIAVPAFLGIGATCLAVALPEERRGFLVAAVICAALTLGILAWAIWDTRQEYRRALIAPAASSIFESGLTGEWRVLRSTGDPLLPYGFQLTVTTEQRLGLGLRVTCSAAIGRIESEGATGDGPSLRRGSDLDIPGGSPEIALFWLQNFPSSRRAWFAASFLAARPIEPIQVERIPEGEVRRLKEQRDALRPPRFSG